MAQPGVACQRPHDSLAGRAGWRQHSTHSRPREERHLLGDGHDHATAAPHRRHGSSRGTDASSSSTSRGPVCPRRSEGGRHGRKQLRVAQRSLDEAALLVEQLCVGRLVLQQQQQEWGTRG